MLMLRDPSEQLNGHGRLWIALTLVQRKVPPRDDFFLT